MLLNQIFFTLLILPQFLDSSQYLDRYFGDFPIEQYFKEDLCPFASTKDINSKLKIILLKINHFKAKNAALTQFEHCFDTILINDSPQILNPTFEYKELLVFIESSFQANQLLANLKQFDLLYQKCGNCFPFYILLPDSLRIKQNIQTILPYLSLNFSATLLSTTKPNKTILIRPFLDGCSRYPGIYQPKTAIDFARLRSSFKSCSLHNKTLTVSVNDAPPFCGLKSLPNGSFTLKNDNLMDNNLLRLLERKYTFKSTFMSAGQFWGISKLPNGTRFNGMIGHVYSGQADIGICALTLSLRRSQFVAFTHFTHYDYLCYLTMRPKVKSRKWILLYPFSPPVWLAILATFLLLTAILTRAMKCPRLYQTSSASIITILSKILLKQSQTSASFTQSSPIRFILTLWLLGTVILSNSYSGVFYSYLAIPEYEPPIESKEDLLRFLLKPANTLLTTEFYLNAFLVAKPENTLYHRLGRYYNQSSAKRALRINFEDFFLKIAALAPKFAFIHTQLYFELIDKYLGGNSGDNIFHLGTEILNQDRLSVALAKRSPLLGPFNWA